MSEIWLPFFISAESIVADLTTEISRLLSLTDATILLPADKELFSAMSTYGTNPPRIILSQGQKYLETKIQTYYNRLKVMDVDNFALSLYGLADVSNWFRETQNVSPSATTMDHTFFTLQSQLTSLAYEFGAKFSPDKDKARREMLAEFSSRNGSVTKFV